jgi:hypothetical protein
MRIGPRLPCTSLTSRQIEHSGRVPINLLLNDVEPRQLKSQSPPHAVPQAPNSSTVWRPHFSSAVPDYRAEPTPFSLPPQTEGSLPPTTEEYDIALPHDDPLWDVVAVHHMAGRVKTPAASVAYQWYEAFFKDKKRKWASEKISDEPRRFGPPRLT